VQFLSDRANAGKNAEVMLAATELEGAGKTPSAVKARRAAKVS